jgi:sugar phosphate isomerase/epimerase
MNQNSISRRSLLTLAAMSPLAGGAAPQRKIPVGLQLASVRNEMAQDPLGTVRAVAKMGYECVEFWAPCYYWTPKFAKEVRKILDDAGVRCYSTLNDIGFLTPSKIQQAIDVNQALGSTLLVASDAEAESLDDWKAVAASLNRAADKVRPLGFRVGYHNHEEEFTPVGGKLPMAVIAANTAKDVVLQLDTGNCLQGGGDPVAWIEQNPGRIRTLHCKDWIPAPKPKCYFVGLGEGHLNWKKLFEAAEKTGGVEYYLIEQGTAPKHTPMENAALFLPIFRKLHGD